MPFNAEGIRPDIIINPHGFVSRMTIGMLVEALAGKACALRGCACNATAFSNIDTDKFGHILEGHGYRASGHEQFYDGRTGEAIRRPLFIGVVTYQRLRHLVLDKINSRARGARHCLTNQPIDGRSRGGGLRIGEMERDALVSHGARATLHERLFISSDQSTVHVCTKCGNIAEPPHNRAFSFGIRGAEAYCRACNVSTCKEVALPAAQKLLIQELAATHGMMRLG